jgi:hypothetical protein
MTNLMQIYKLRDRTRSYLKKRVKKIINGARTFFPYHGIAVTNNDKRLVSLKNKHEGRRCFVIGNGPSLTIEDLTNLHEHNEITIASNKIYLAYEKTEWRPTYYTVADILVAENNSEEINLINGIKLFPDNLKAIFKCSNSDAGCNGINIYFRSLESQYDNNGKYFSQFSTDALKGFHVGETVTNFNIQLAYYLGCNPIYVIGIDGIYQTPETTTKHDVYQNVFVSQGEINHFHNEYRKKGETWSIPKPEYHEIAYKCCRDFLERHGVTILNASRRSSVKSFQRADFDTIL